MSDRHLEPARSVIALMGGVVEVSAITGKHVSRVYRWMYSKEKGGTGGYVPQEDAAKLLKAAPERGVSLTPAAFFPSAEAAA